MLDSMRTFVLTCQTPYPPVGGAAMRNWQNISILKSLGPVAVFSIPLSFNQKQSDNGQAPPGLEFWEEQVAEVEKLGQAKILRRLTTYFQSPVAAYYRDEIARSLDRALSEFQPDLVVVSEIGLSPYLKQIKRHNCKIIFDDHNIEALLFREKQQAVQGLKGKVKRELGYIRLKKLEQLSIQLADQVWLCSELDGQRFQELYGDFRHIRIVPNGIDVAHYRCVFSGEIDLPEGLDSCPRNVLFIGNFGYSPNRVAAQWLLDEIFPLLQGKHPESRLILAGSSPTLEMVDAAKQNPNIIVTGRVEDLRPYLASADVMIVPLLQGGGTRLKILEAFAAGRVVVSTDKGAEGLGCSDRHHLLIRNDAPGLVSGVCELWDDPRLRHELAHNALELVQSDYSWQAIARHVKSHVQELFA